MDKLKRYGPPKGQLDLVLETSTSTEVENRAELNIDIAVAQQISQQDNPNQIAIKKELEQGKTFECRQFDDFYQYFQANLPDLPPYCRTLSKTTLNQYWNAWFALDPKFPEEATYIESLFISPQFMKEMYQFRGGIAIENLPTGYRKGQSRRDYKKFLIELDPNASASQLIDDYAIPWQSDDLSLPYANSADFIQHNLASLTPSKRLWWDCLIKRHKDSLPNEIEFSQVEERSLLSLFLKFIEEMEVRGLRFDETIDTDMPANKWLETRFPHAQEFRTTLSYIRTILNHAKHRGKNDRLKNENDVSTVWKGIAKLHLSSNEAMVAVYGQSHSVVLPEMRIETKYDIKPSNISRYLLAGYRALDMGHDYEGNLDKMPEDDFIAYLMRTVSEKQHRYAIDFYLQAIERVKTHFPKDKYVQRQLCCLLMSSTTQSAVFCTEPWEDALKRWDKMLGLFEDFPLPNIMGVSLIPNIKIKISTQIIDSFYGLKTYPSLKMLSNISQMAAGQVKAARSRKEVEAIQSKLQTQFGKLDTLASEYFGLALYDGMRFVDAHTPPIDLATYLRLVDDFRQQINLEESPHGSGMLRCSDARARELVRLISTFNLTAVDLTEIYHQLPWNKDEDEYDNTPNDYVIYALEQLSSLARICLERGKCLNSADLKAFIVALSEQTKAVETIDKQERDEEKELINRGPETEIENEVNDAADKVSIGHRPQAYLKIADKLLKAQFEAFFPEGYFLPEVPLSVRSDISSQFINPADEETVNRLFERLKLSGQSIDYPAILEKMKRICNILSERDKSVFLTKLSHIIPQKGMDFPERISDEIQALLTRLLNPEDGAKHRQAFTLFFKLKGNLPKEIQTQLTRPLYPQLKFWLDSHVSLSKSFSPSIPRAQIAELGVSALLRQEKLSNQNQIKADLEQILAIYDDMRKQYPIAETSLWQFLSHYQKLSHPSPTHIADMKANLTILKDVFDLFDEESAQDYVLSLSFHFNGLQAVNGLTRTPQGLLDICKDPRFTKLTKLQQKIFLMMLAKVLNQEKALGKKDLDKLMEKFAQPEKLFSALELSYQGVPYPSLKKFLSWYEKPDYSDETLIADLKAFNLKPCQRETGLVGEKASDKLLNGFHVDVAQRIAPNFKGVDISEKEMRYLSDYTKAVRQLTPDQLLEKLREYRQQYREDVPSTAQQLAALVAITAEFLYRVKGIDSPVMGASYEINTTQYLAIYALLKMGSMNQKDVMAAMGTGEGKSRCIAILNICGLAQGKTVDALTRSLELATRDYLEFHAFYSEVTKTFDTKVNLLSVNSSFDQYSIGGLNISDVSHRQRFVNRAIVSGQKDTVVDPNPEKRMMTLDEADLFRLPHLENKYTLASAPDPDWQKMPWIYDAVMDFFAQNDSQPESGILKAYLDLSGVDDNQVFEAFDGRFLAFVQANPHYQKVLDDLKVLAKEKPHRLDELYRAAYQARQLEFGKAMGFGIKLNVVEDSMVFPMADPSARFSLGVQQCLAVRMNRYYDLLKKSQQFPESLSAWEKQILVQEKTLMDKLAEGDSYFSVDVQRQTEYSTTARNLFETYEEGQAYCFSGTPTGADYEREELTLKGTHVLEIPRHLGLCREDRAVIVAKDEDKQLKALIAAIQNARKLRQPILLLCADDKSARKQFDLLVKYLGEEEIQFVPSNASGDVLKDHVMNAGASSGMLTVATEKFGRGIDIKLSPEALAAGGLCTIIDFLPETERELEQMFSRSARFGDPGNTQLILNRKALEARYGSNSLKRDFYLAPEEHLQKLTAKLNRRKQCERAISECVDAFHGTIQNSVFEKIYPQKRDDFDQEGLNQVRGLWGEFQKNREVTWERHWAKIKERLDPERPDISGINRELEVYHTGLSDSWQHFLWECDSIMPSNKDITAGMKNLDPLELSGSAKKILLSSRVNTTEKIAVPVRAKYESTHDAKRIVYSKPFEKLSATLRGERKMFADLRAWWRNEGILFPNLSAYWAGKLTLFQAFTCYGGTFLQFITNTDVSKTKQSKHPVRTSDTAEDVVSMSLDNVFKLVEDHHKGMSPAVMASAGLVRHTSGTSQSDVEEDDMDDSKPLLPKERQAAATVLPGGGDGDKRRPIVGR